MTLRALLEKILNTYLQEKNKPLKGNSLAKCFRSGLKNVVSDDLISGSLITKGHQGKGVGLQYHGLGYSIRQYPFQLPKGLILFIYFHRI